MSSALSVLTRNPSFRRLFLAELVVFGADWFVMVPLLVLLPELTGSGVWGGLVLAADTGIIALLLPFTGTVADRLDRKKIMMVANLASVAAVLVLLAVRSASTAWVAVAAIGLLAVAKAFYSPAGSAALPNVVDVADLAAANAVAGSAWGTMAVVGASLGGVLSSVFSPYTCFWVAGALLALAAGVTWRIRRPLQAERDSTASARTWPAILESMHYIRRRPRVFALVTVKCAVGLGNGVLATFPFLAVAFGVGAIGTGALFAARGAGALIGPLLMRRVVTHRAWLLPALAVSMSTYGLAYLGVSLARWFPLVLGLVVVAHLAGGANWMTSSYALQREVPDRLLGRVFAADMMIATIAISVSQLVVGALIDTVDMHILIAGSGATTLLYAVAWRLVTRRLPPESQPESTVEPADDPRQWTHLAAEGPVPSPSGDGPSVRRRDPG